MGLHPNTVVATELVSSINPTHTAVVQLDAEWASDVTILGLTLHGGCSCGGQIRERAPIQYQCVHIFVIHLPNVVFTMA